MNRSGLRSGVLVRAIGVAVGLVAVACSELPSPVVPSVAVTGQQSVANGGPGLPLIPVVGAGGGSFNLVHTESNRNGFTSDAQFTVSVHGVTPNTVLYVRRAGDLGLTGGQQTDGICQRAAAGLFGPLPAPDGTPVTLETSPGGSGTTHVHLYGMSEGNRLDAVFRVVDVLPPAVPTIDLRTPCFTFIVK